MQKQMTKAEIKGHKSRMQARLDGLAARREELWRAGQPEDKTLEREIRFWQHKLGLI